MSRLRHSTVTFAVLALVATVLTLATTPATAQDGTPPPPPEFFVFTNVMTNPPGDSNNDGVPDTRWQVQVRVDALGGCVPKSGAASYVSPWINAGEEVGASLSTSECVFRISARARVEARPDCTYRAELGWAAGDGTVSGDYRAGSVITSGRPGDERRLSIRRDPGAGCARPNRTYFVLGGESIVEELPAAAADRDLMARARRAATLGNFTVRVEPAPGSPAAGCDIAADFAVRGDASSSPQALGATGDRCPARASITSAPAHLKISEGGYVTFDAALPNIIVDLTPLVRMEAARIAVIQDVAGSDNRGEATYAIARSCGGVPLTSPPAQATSTPLHEGRFTVHSPDILQFGPAGIYPAVATSHNSAVVVGCAVSVTVSRLTSDCAVAGGNTRTLTWTAADPFPHFDFEFDIGCGAAAPPSIPVPPPPPGPGDAPAQEPSGEAIADAGLEDVRIVARRLANGKIEFGLQQRRDDTSWGGRLLPQQRLFPAGAAVGDWLVSSPVTVRVGEAADASATDVGLRITARLVGDGRVEFALQQRLEGGEWGDRQAPVRRFFPAAARVDRWLHSSVISLAL